jgi:hypothetical protein
MSTPTSDRLRRWALVPLLAGGLGACAAGMISAERASLRVEGARVTIVAPQGLCIDPQSPDVGRGGGYLLIGDCALFRKVPDRATPLTGVITVSISTGGLDGGLDELEGFLKGPGKAGLSRVQNADSVTVLDSRRTNNALFLKIRDTSPSEIPGSSAEYWRVFFVAGTRLVTGSIVAFSDARVPDTRAIALLSELENRTSAANPRPAAPVVTPDPETEAEVEAEVDAAPEADSEAAAEG